MLELNWIVAHPASVEALLNDMGNPSPSTEGGKEIVKYNQYMYTTWAKWTNTILGDTDGQILSIIDKCNFMRVEVQCYYST